MTKVTKEQAAVQFLATHGAVISAALGWYSDEMGKGAEDAQKEYEFLRSVPAAQEANDAPSDPDNGTVTIRPTTRGYRQNAEILREAADSADKAQAALTNYEEVYE